MGLDLAHLVSASIIGFRFIPFPHLKLPKNDTGRMGLVTSDVSKATNRVTHYGSFFFAILRADINRTDRVASDVVMSCVLAQ